MADTPAETPKRRRTTKAEAKPARRATASGAKPAAEQGEAKPPRKRAAKAAAPAPAQEAQEAKEAKEAKPAPARKPRRAAAAPAADAKPKRAPRKAAAPKAAATPAPETEEQASGISVAALAERAREALPDVSPRTGVLAALGTLAAVGGAFFVWRASRAEEPNYQTIESDGPIEIRKYPAMVTAGTEHRGERRAALDEGFRTLADYIFARSRPGARIPMTAPVLSDTDKDGSWRTRFIMPTGKARGELPQPPSGVELVAEPAARVAAFRFSGRADDATLNAKEGALRSWLQLRGFPSEGKAIHAFYNAPFLPGPLRRNEIMIVLSNEGGTGA